MSEQKLSPEQIEAAAKAAFTVLNSQTQWHDTFMQDHYRKAMIAAAPHLQYPIAEPTKAEGERLIKIYDSYPASLVESAMAALRDFIANRNAAMQPKPDPRREAILNTVRDCMVAGQGVSFAEEVTGKICAALDALKDAK